VHRLPNTESLLQSTNTLRPRKKRATVRSNPVRIGAGAREAVNCSAWQPDRVKWRP
jgi:hypothetical protein